VLTNAEQDELDALQGFINLLGVTEMEDDDFARYLELIRKRNNHG